MPSRGECAALTLLCWAMTASATSAGPAEDAAALEACMAQRQAVESCVGVLSGPCIDRAENQTTLGMTDCVLTEAQAWDHLLNADYKRLIRGLDAEQERDLRAAQRAWIAYRDKSCPFYHVLIRGSMSQNLAADCFARETARRVADLRDYLGWNGQ